MAEYRQTHVVPTEGLPAWAGPDANAVERLPAHRTRAAMTHFEPLLLIVAFAVSAGLLWLAAGLAMAAATRGATVALALLGRAIIHDRGRP